MNLSATCVYIENDYSIALEAYDARLMYFFTVMIGRVRPFPPDAAARLYNRRKKRPHQYLIPHRNLHCRPLLLRSYGRDSLSTPCGRCPYSMVAQANLLPSSSSSIDPAILPPRAAS